MITLTVTLKYLFDGTCEQTLIKDRIETNFTSSKT